MLVYIGKKRWPEYLCKERNGKHSVEVDRAALCLAGCSAKINGGAVIDIPYHAALQTLVLQEINFIIRTGECVVIKTVGIPVISCKASGEFILDQPATDDR